jgi:GTP-binding protein EngB required for normal cell division
MRPLLSYPLIYNQRIYYLNTEEERDRVMRNPKMLEMNQSVPNDVRVIPSVAVIGLTKTGKSSLVDSVSSKLGLVKLSL